MAGKNVLKKLWNRYSAHKTVQINRKLYILLIFSMSNAHIKRKNHACASGEKGMRQKGSRRDLQGCAIPGFKDYKKND